MCFLLGAGGSVNLTREIRGLIVRNLSFFSNALYRCNNVMREQHQFASSARFAIILPLGILLRTMLLLLSPSKGSTSECSIVGGLMRNLCVQVLRSLNAKRASMQERQTRLEREGEIWTLLCLTLAIQSIVLIPVQGFGMLGEDVEEDLSHILSANV